MSHVFISYSKKDISFARHLCDLLRRSGFDVWIDENQLQASEVWWKVIERNVTVCGAFVVIMSPNSKELDWVEREILLAEKQKKSIFPVLLAGEGWPRLADIQYEDMHERLPLRTQRRVCQEAADSDPRAGVDRREFPASVP